MRILWFILLVAVAVGCAPKSSTSVERAPSTTTNISVLDEAKVLAIARQTVSTNDTWVDRAEFHTPERRPDGSWSVLVVRLPRVVGGHRLILIDEKGTVTMYDRGE
jgi:hypothetical protein